VKFPKNTFSNSASTRHESFHFRILGERIRRRAGGIVAARAADFLIIALFRYVSTLRPKFHPRRELETWPAEMRIIKRDRASGLVGNCSQLSSSPVLRRDKIRRHGFSRVLSIVCIRDGVLKYTNKSLSLKRGHCGARTPGIPAAANEEKLWRSRYAGEASKDIIQSHLETSLSLSLSLSLSR